MAYGMSTSEALGYGPGLDLDDYNSLLIHVDYQKDLLEISIMSVTQYVTNRERVLRIFKFGGPGSEKCASVRNHSYDLRCLNILTCNS